MPIGICLGGYILRCEHLHTMKLHINIFSKYDFYLTVSREDPYKVEIVEVTKSIQQTKIEEEQLERNLDRINMWISSCDQKTSFLLALVGAVLTIVFTSDAVKLIKKVLINPFLDYWLNDIGDLDYYRLIIAILLILGLVFCFCSVLYLLLSIYARINYDTLRKSGMEESSWIYFGTIAEMTYGEFCRSRDNHYNDLSSQVYVNSIICTKKYKNYKKGLLMLVFALPMLVIAFLLILFI